MAGIRGAEKYHRQGELVRPRMARDEHVVNRHECLTAADEYLDLVHRSGTVPVFRHERVSAFDAAVANTCQDRLQFIWNPQCRRGLIGRDIFVAPGCRRDDIQVAPLTKVAKGLVEAEHELVSNDKR